MAVLVVTNTGAEVQIGENGEIPLTEHSVVAAAALDVREDLSGARFEHAAVEPEIILVIRTDREDMPVEDFSVYLHIAAKPFAGLLLGKKERNDRVSNA